MSRQTYYLPVEPLSAALDGDPIISSFLNLRGADGQPPDTAEQIWGRKTICLIVAHNTEAYKYLTKMLFLTQFLLRFRSGQNPLYPRTPFICSSRCSYY